MRNNIFKGPWLCLGMSGSIFLKSKSGITNLSFHALFQHFLGLTLYFLPCFFHEDAIMFYHFYTRQIYTITNIIWSINIILWFCIETIMMPSFFWCYKIHSTYIKHQYNLLTVQTPTWWGGSHNTPCHFLWRVYKKE